ncbi:MAG: hypothetical protein DCF22_11145 [Leptolyngbya sp.]|nr:MAG: hypothetical protein DCF22_11145 [Leptolyngbya sp.]
MLNKLKIPKQLRQKIDQELEPNESIRWIGQPNLKVSHLIIGCFAVSLFAIPWTAFAMFWIYGVLGYKIPDLREGFQPQYLFALFGVPFVLAGLGMLSSPFWVWRAAFEKVYIITDKRAIAFEGAGTTTIRSFEPQQLAKIYRRENNDGTGDVMIIVRSWKDSDGDLQNEEVGFLAIPNPKQVETLLKELAQTAL